MNAIKQGQTVWSLFDGARGDAGRINGDGTAYVKFAGTPGWTPSRVSDLTNNRNDI